MKKRTHRKGKKVKGINMLVSCLHSNCDFLLFDDTAPPRVLTCEELAYLPFKTIYYLIKNQLLFIAIPLAKKQTVV